MTADLGFFTPATIDECMEDNIHDDPSSIVLTNPAQDSKGLGDSLQEDNMTEEIPEDFDLQNTNAIFNFLIGDSKYINAKVLDARKYLEIVRRSLIILGFVTVARDQKCRVSCCRINCNLYQLSNFDREDIFGINGIQVFQVVFKVTVRVC